MGKARATLLWTTFVLALSLALAGCGGNTESSSTSAPLETSPVSSSAASSDVTLSDDSSDFVLLSDAVPDAILEIRYYSTYNFVGDRIDGYEEPLAFMTKEAAAALKDVSDELVAKGYRLKIYDAYRPQMAVTNFVEWAQDANDTRMKEYFYPELEKDVLFPQGYIMEHSGHSRGSTVDLTLFDMATEKEVDMGGTFDYFGELSHPDYTGITDEQYANRMTLRDAMLAHGFKPLAEEWWHFTLEDEPYPDTYFTFPINSETLAGGARSDDGAATIANPWSEAATAQAAAEGAGVGAFNLPADGAAFAGGEIHWIDYRYMEGLAEANGAIGSAELTVRKGLQSAEQEVADGAVDVSGDWNAYKYSWDVDANGTQVRCSGNEDGRAMKAAWSSGDHSFAIMVRGQGDVRDIYGLGADDITALAGAIG